MKELKAMDYWRAINSKSYPQYVKSFSFEDLQNFENSEIFFEQGGIIAFCGVNGAGKSTLLAALRSILEKHEIRAADTLVIKKLRNAKIKGVIKLKENLINNHATHNEVGELIEENISGTGVLFIDPYSTKETLKYFQESTNIEEIVEQYEEVIFDENQLRESSQIIGKTYTSVKYYKIEDVEKFDDLTYFKVISNGVEYDSTEMGFGEHALFLMYLQIITAHPDSIILIEEPEAFISPYSQKWLLNYLAYYSTKNNLLFFITTHSPIVLKKIKSENIFILKPNGTMITVSGAKNEYDYYNYLGFHSEKKGIIITEDRAAREFSKLWLNYHMTYSSNMYFIIDAHGGESEIKKALRFIKIVDSPFKIIGLFDGDIENETVKTGMTSYNWPLLFLPTKFAPEQLLKQIAEANQDLFAEKINKNSMDVRVELTRLKNDDHHDWLLNISGAVGVDYNVILSTLFYIWISDNTNLEISKTAFNKFKTALSQ